MKVLLAVKAFANAGGAERVLADVANGLAARGHQVIVISYERLDEHPFYALHPNVSWHRLGLGNPKGPAAMLETVARIFGLRYAIKRIEPDIVIGFMSSMYIPLGWALVGSGIPLIASEHTTAARYKSRPLERLLLLAMRWLAHTITVVSAQALESHPPVLQSRMAVIPNPVRIEARRRADVKGGIKRRNILLSVGRLIESKDYSTLIDAFALIAHQAPRWDMRIVGDGSLRVALQEQIRALGLAERITLPGTTFDVAAEYEGAQLFVLPSRFESLGLVVIEALIHGLPTVGFADCSGLNQLIRPGYNGSLAAGTNRVAALAQALVPLMADDALRQSLVPPCFELPEAWKPEQVLNSWEQLLQRCVPESSERARKHSGMSGTSS
jgi:glycosyltransferase involved in cell wall biosynthesis